VLYLYPLKNQTGKKVPEMTLTKLAVFAGGMLFGTAGLKILGSKDAKKVYAHTTAAVLRAKDSVMETVTVLRENADDILAQARAINDTRLREEAVVEDSACRCETECGEEPDASCCCDAAEETEDDLPAENNV
jgi:hypothetical protein